MKSYDHTCEIPDKRPLLVPSLEHTTGRQEHLISIFYVKGPARPPASMFTGGTRLLVLQRNQHEVINFMKLLTQRYIQYYNRKYHGTDKLWENRYKLHPVDPELYHIILKLEMIPVRTGMLIDGASYHLLGKEGRAVMADYFPTPAFSYGELFY